MADERLKAALDLASNLYMQRVQAQVNRQLAQMREGREPTSLVLCGPSLSEVNAILAALQAAEDRALSNAWRIADDAANETRKGEKRNVADQIADDIRDLRSTSYALAATPPTETT